MCDDLPDCVREILGMLILLVAPTIITYLLWSGTTG
jgi:hypothetical protein